MRLEKRHKLELLVNLPEAQWDLRIKDVDRTAK